MAAHDENVVWHAHPVTAQQREQLHGHRGVVLWFTGLSGSGKSTVAGALEEALHELGVSTYLLDGDNVRHGLCNDLGFSDADRVNAWGTIVSLRSLSIHHWQPARLAIRKGSIRKRVLVNCVISPELIHCMNRPSSLRSTWMVNN